MMLQCPVARCRFDNGQWGSMPSSLPLDALLTKPFEIANSTSQELNAPLREGASGWVQHSELCNDIFSGPAPKRSGVETLTQPIQLIERRFTNSLGLGIFQTREVIAFVTGFACAPFNTASEYQIKIQPKLLFSRLIRFLHQCSTSNHLVSTSMLRLRVSSIRRFLPCVNSLWQALQYCLLISDTASPLKLRG